MGNSNGPETRTSEIFAGDSEMAERIRAFDWQNTPLGPIESWSPALRMMTSILLANRFPMLLWWGPDFHQIYNDPYSPIPGKKHPNSLGQAARECWAEIWHVIGPLIETPFRGGPATWMEDIFLQVDRHGFLEETHFTIAYSPVPDETAPRGIGGVLATVHEITQKVVGERRLALLRDLGTRSAHAKSAEQACVLATDTLKKHPEDVPFALLYLVDVDRKRAQLAASCGVEPHAAKSYATIDLLRDHADWPLRKVLETEELHLVDGLANSFQPVPSGPWSDPPTSAALVPVRSNVAGQSAGFLIAGISSRLRFDEQYQSFFELMSAQIATAVANARAYEEERKRAEALAEIDRAKTEFFSNVSHEFRTPLTLMLGNLEEILARDGEVLSSTRVQIEAAHRNSIRLLKMVNNLLDFSRIEANRINASFEPANLSAFTSDLASSFRSAIEKAGIKLKINCPPLSQDIFVDREMWEKIVLNLVSNAFKFTLEGEIELSLIEKESLVELQVRDTGVGIPADQLGEIFKRFHRVRSTQGRTHEGTGIGLALVQELVKQHGGTISVSSELGKGATFTVQIPKGRAHLPADRISAPREMVSTATGAEIFLNEAAVLDVHSDLGAALPSITRPANETILLADDSADMREYVRRLLTQSGYRVEAVGDGQAALDAVERVTPDLILTDVMMPRLDGFGLLATLRADEKTKTIPVIMLSARAGEESKIEGLEAGADDYLIKPFSARELLARVGSHLEIARIRRDSEAAVRDSEEHMRIALSAGKFGNWQLELADLKLTASNQFKANIGRAPDEQFTYEMFRASIHPDDHEMVGAQLSRAIAEVTDYEADYRCVWPDGTVRWISDRGRAIAGPDGRAARVVGVALDITERKQAERRLRLLNEISELIRTKRDPYELSFAVATAVGKHFHARRCLFNETDVDSDLEIVHRDYCDNVESVAGLHKISDYSDATSADMKNGVTVVNFDSRNDPRTAEDYQRSYEPHGERAYVAVPLMRGHRWVASLWISDDRPRIWSEDEVSLLETIAERTWTAIETTRIDAALRRSEAKYRSLFDSMDEGYILVDVVFDESDRPIDLLCLEANAAAVKMAGAELAGRRASEIRNFGTHFFETFGRVARTGSGERHEFSAASRNAWYNFYVFKVGEPHDSRVAAVYQDITARKEADGERERLLAREHEARAAAESANRLKDEFLATLSHELRNPLNVVLGYAELMLRTPDISDSPRLRQMATVLRKNALAQAQLVNDLLDLSRLQMGKVSLEFETILLATTIENAVDTVRSDAAAKGLTLNATLDSDVSVSGDSLRLQQIAWNLLNNAVKFTPEGGSISVTLAKNDRFAVLSVADTGQGIDPKFLPHIFEMFRQADAGFNRQHSGLGIGLALVWQLVKLHNGTVEAESKGLGKGACFTIQLPLTREVQSPLALLPEIKRASDLRQMNALVVDDSEDTVEMLRMMLEKDGATVWTARRGTEALELAAKQKFDVVLSDISMPGMDGFEFLHRLRELEANKDVPVLALTGFGRSEDIVRAESAGFHAHFAKPLDVKALSETLERVLSQKRRVE
jgi:PAS domain S-box-containing protein